MLGLAAGTRLELPVLALPLGCPDFPSRIDDPMPRRGFLVALAPFSLAFAAVTMATTGWYNWAKTGSILLTGHDEQTEGPILGCKPYIGVFGALFSSGFGLFTFNPVAVRRAFSPCHAEHDSRRTEAIVVSLLSSRFSGPLQPLRCSWYGGFTWANRYLTVILPFAVLPTGVLLERSHRTPHLAPAGRRSHDTSGFVNSPGGPIRFQCRLARPMALRAQPDPNSVRSPFLSHRGARQVAAPIPRRRLQAGPLPVPPVRLAFARLLCRAFLFSITLAARTVAMRSRGPATLASWCGGATGQQPMPVQG